MNVSIEERVTAFVNSLARCCKNCKHRGASCFNCAIDGAESLAEELNKGYCIATQKSETRKRKDIVLKMLSSGPLPSREIKLDCGRYLKYATLRSMEQGGEITSFRQNGKQNLYKLSEVTEQQQR